MSLFGNKRKRDLQYQPPVFLGEVDITAEALNYDSVVDWLTCLSESDYDKVIGVVQVYRQAEFEECQILKVEVVPTTFINPPEQTLDADDELMKAFEGSEPDPVERKHKKPKAKRKS